MCVIFHLTNSDTVYRGHKNPYLFLALRVCKTAHFSVAMHLVK